MPLARFKDLCIDAVDPALMAGFWGGLLGLEAQAAGDTGARLVGRRPEKDWHWLLDVPGLPFDSIDFVPVPEPKTVKNRVHWDVTVADAAAVDELVRRGATVLRRPDDEIGWTVLADLEGNEFCAFLAGDTTEGG